MKMLNEIITINVSQGRTQHNKEHNIDDDGNRIRLILGYIAHHQDSLQTFYHETKEEGTLISM